ncbi:CHRD domain-containing protein [Arsukibacterium sp.]|uniref:CHRD domain-containing protein n=1 Tax=Arsukibacterium sp. TaxID=1977258 RepID=UPI001BD6912D|nr:CHRD domain-containing protein [Arsukibacterium sp.]
MKRLLYLALPLFVLGGCFDGSDDDEVIVEPPPVFSVDQTFEVSLSGVQQVPNVDSMQMAVATVELDTDLMQIRASMDLSDVENVEAAHIHDGDLGFNGDVAFEFTAGNDGVYSIAETDITAELMADLQNGEWYINVHTTEYPDGEIRGQIVNEDTVIVTFPLSGQQEVPAVMTSASGFAYAAVDQTDYELTLTVRTMGVDDAEMAHIHTGRVGTNGDVLVALEAYEDEAGVWVIPADTMIDQATFEVLAGGGHYVNVHTPANPGGELRGQILTDNFVLATFGLSGSQEVPMVDTQASGDGYALVNTDDYMVEVVAVTSGVDFATMAHIHTGRIGNNGDVLVGLVQSADDLGTWMTPEDTQIDEETFAVLASGGHYVNVHTPDNPGGELRGQILTDNFVLATFALSGAQEVPAVSTMASGEGYALVNTADYSVELVALTEGVDDATMAHIHTGRVGNNGDVLVALEQDMAEPG